MGLSTAPSQSEAAMESFLKAHPGLQNPEYYVLDPTLPDIPTLNDLAPPTAVNQSAGDIARIGKPLDPQFNQYLKDLRTDTSLDAVDAAGNLIYPIVPGEVDGWSANYKVQYPKTVQRVIESWELPVKESADSPGFEGIQTVSGRAGIDMTLYALKRISKEVAPDKKPVLIMDPFAWGGYGALAPDHEMGQVNAPVNPDKGLGQTVEGVQASLDLIRRNGEHPAGIVLIVPSNPTGVGIETQELKNIILLAAKEGVPVFIDAFYSPLAPEGHADVVGLNHLISELPPEVLDFVMVMVGETKTVSSNDKTSTVMSYKSGKTPTGKSLAELVRRQMHGVEIEGKPVVPSMKERGVKFIKNRNLYPKPAHARNSHGLYTFEGGVHGAMGERYQTLAATRDALDAVFEARGQAYTKDSKSFYGYLPLVDPDDPDATSYIRKTDGRPVTDPGESLGILAKAGLVGAPGYLFRSGLDAAKTIRLTATATQEDVQRVAGIIDHLRDNARRHG